MPTLKTRVIPKPKEGTRAVLIPKTLPAVRGNGDTNYECGGCGVVLLERIAPGQIKGLVFQCPSCSAFSEV